MVIINQELLENTARKYVSNLNYYMRSMAPQTNFNEIKNLNTDNVRFVSFNDKVDVRYYELEENEKEDKRIMYNHIKMKSKLRDIVNGID